MEVLSYRVDPIAIGYMGIAMVIEVTWAYKWINHDVRIDVLHPSLDHDEP